ncbi:MAG: hypothetical protein D6813_12720 [Calditrichaeota bacterium]|nr:MAG: hypothetical protein D6813_12720 [Calditrichota bacterium]
MLIGIWDFFNPILTDHGNKVDFLFYQKDSKFTKEFYHDNFDKLFHILSFLHLVDYEFFLKISHGY